jgi:hypothetical protein
LDRLAFRRPKVEAVTPAACCCMWCSWGRGREAKGEGAPARPPRAVALGGRKALPARGAVGAGEGLTRKPAVVPAHNGGQRGPTRPPVGMAVG